MALGGTSAGGGLALAATQKLRQLGLDLPGALWAGTPWADLTKTGDSQFTNEGIDRMLVTYDGILEAAAKLYAGSQDLKTTLISPVYGTFEGFLPTYLVTGTRDLFLSDTVRVHSTCPCRAYTTASSAPLRGQLKHNARWRNDAK